MTGQEACKKFTRKDSVVVLYMGLSQAHAQSALPYKNNLGIQLAFQNLNG